MSANTQQRGEGAVIQSVTVVTVLRDGTHFSYHRVLASADSADSVIESHCHDRRERHGAQLHYMVVVRDGHLTLGRVRPNGLSAFVPSMVILTAEISSDPPILTQG